MLLVGSFFIFIWIALLSYFLDPIWGTTFPYIAAALPPLVVVGKFYIVGDLGWFMVVYLASPIASTKSKDEWSSSDSKLSRNEEIALALREIGLDVYVPQEHQDMSMEDVWKEQQGIIRDCDFLILVMSDTRGIYIEAGYAKALGKKVYALEVEEMRKYSDWARAVVDYIAKDIDDLVDYLKKNV